MKEIYHCFWINTPLPKVYWAITENSGLSGWWTRNAEVANEEGNISIFRFRSGAFNKMMIKSLTPAKIVWECIDGHEEWIGTQVIFELKKDGERTKVCFSHCGWKTQTEYTGECSFHWAYYLGSLKKYCETGHGTPDQGYNLPADTD